VYVVNTKSNTISVIPGSNLDSSAANMTSNPANQTTANMTSSVNHISLQGANMTAGNMTNSTTSNATTTGGSVDFFLGLSVVKGPLVVGNRTLSLVINVHPPSNLTNADLIGSTESMQFKLFDTSNNQTIKHVTYEVTVTKGNSSSLSQKPLLLDFFHAHNGLLALIVEPTNGPLTIFGEKDPFLQAWLADPRGNILPYYCREVYIISILKYLA
jgi:hypothetical protein